MKVIQILKESSPPDLMKGFEDFLPLAMSVLEIDKLPPIKIVKDVPGSQPSFGGFDQDSGIIYLQITNRHPLDIFRTLAHELVHFKQNTEHKLDGESGLTGSPMENEANATAGIVMRHFNKKYPEYLSHRPLIKEDASDYEIHNYKKLDRILTMLCKMVIKGQKSNKDYGMVAACVLDPDNQIVARLNYPAEDGLRVHAERAAMEAYQSKYGEIPEGSIIITTLSPCNELSDETADGRSGNNCTDLINNSTVRKVYCGYIDPSQGDEAHDERDFNLMETENGKIRDLCKSFADTFLDEDYHPNDTPRGPEFKPTMPAGTVRVDVSDVYDWYKLGKNIANLKRANARDFGKGPPSTIMSFGSEPEEHKYINDLKKLGLTTTDIDPIDPKQPKKMPRQKVDPTYNVGENFADGRNPQDKGDNKENPADQVRNKLNAWMEQDQQYEDPTQRAGFQAKVWPYIQKNLKTILADKGEKGNGDYPAAPYAAWLLVQHMDAYPQNQIEFYNALKQAIPDHPKIQFLRDRAAVNQWIMKNANNPEYFIKGKALPNPTVNVRNPAMFKDAGIVSTSREEALANAKQAGNKLLVAAVQATNAQTQPSYKQSANENFHDGRNPQDKGDSKRYGVPTKASVSTLRKVAKQGGRKGQLAHWMANMKSGKAKKK